MPAVRPVSPPLDGAREPGRAWRRAAVYGSLWAAVEIVAGSFLHNLRVPLAGMVLSAFGVTVLTAGHRSRPERGLIWRAALVCALMKSVSPSAVILGPMVGIAMEGVLLEASVRLLGGSAAGYLVGGALAVSWSLAQRLLTAVTAFGPDVVRLYVETYGFAARSLGVSRFGPFDLVAALAVVECAVGVAAAALGLRVALDARGLPAAPAGPTPAPAFARGAPIVAEGEWSVRRLALVSAALLAGMAGLAFVPLWGGLVYVGGFAAFVLRAYPRAAGRVRRPSLWIEMALVMLLAGALLGGVRGGRDGLASGVAAGAAMVLRATMMLLGFAALSVELRNPSLLSWVERRHLRGLSDALGAAFGTLPAFTAELSQRRGEWRHPARFLAGMVRLADRLAAGSEGHGAARRCVILRGPTGSGKTTLVREVVARLRERGRTVAGILAPGLLQDGRRVGFDLVDLATGESTTLARETPHVEGPHARWSRFAFADEGLALGRRALGRNAQGADVVVVDEVGPFELAGGGWAGSLDGLARDYQGALLLVVRETIVEAVRDRWGSPDTVVWNVEQGDPERVARLLAPRPAEASLPAAG
jgi:nucleoside-triphosphatase THEP1